MSDVIWLSGLAAHAHHGVFPFEQREGQRFVLDVGYELDTRPAGRADDVAATVSYSDVAGAVHGVLTGPPFRLLEALAERVAATVLDFAGVAGVTVVVHKPQAPLPVSVADVSLTIRRTPITVVPAAPVRSVLALGGNVGDVPATLRSAVATVREELGEVRVGPLVRTLAMTLPGSGPQPDYWNTVLEARTRLSACEVLALGQRLEARHGRRRDERWGPRTLDVDLVAHGAVRSSDPTLLLPHPGAVDRAFVLVPWAALDPDALLEGRPVGERAAEVGTEVLERVDAWT